jgi:hypothetical protein
MIPDLVSEPPEVRSVDLFEWIAESMIRKVEEQPITVEIQSADGSITVEIPKTHPWFNELNRQRTERLRASFKSTMARR